MLGLPLTDGATTGRAEVPPTLDAWGGAIPFVRLDVRVEKRWTLPETRSITLVFEVQNATLSRETDRLDYGPPFAAPGTCTASSSAPVTIPSVGLETEL